MPNDFLPPPARPVPPAPVNPSGFPGHLFPLFEAPFKDAADYAGPANCSLCGKHNEHCFDLGIGAALILPCPKCKTENGLDADDRKNTPCRKCHTLIPFPKLAEPIRTCPACLRAGKAAITKDTELGMISWDQAVTGITHGLPGLNRKDVELVPGNHGWMGAKIPQSMMIELLRTPTYLTLQGEQWQFCCQRPMIFLGTWSRDDFSRHAPAPGKNGRALFDKIVRDPSDDLWNDEMGDETGIYVFRCSACSRLSAHWDLA